MGRARQAQWNRVRLVNGRASTDAARARTDRGLVVHLDVTHLEAGFADGVLVPRRRATTLPLVGPPTAGPSETGYRIAGWGTPPHQTAERRPLNTGARAGSRPGSGPGARGDALPVHVCPPLDDPNPSGTLISQHRSRDISSFHHSLALSNTAICQVTLRFSHPGQSFRVAVTEARPHNAACFMGRSREGGRMLSPRYEGPMSEISVSNPPESRNRLRHWARRTIVVLTASCCLHLWTPATGEVL